MTTTPDEKDYIAQVCAEEDVERTKRNRRITAELAPVPPAGVICDEVAPITEQAWRSLDSQPAGEAEVVAEVVNKYGDPEAFAERDLLRRTEIDKIKIGTELVDRAHVTRLQAENAAIQQRLNVADQRVDDLTAENARLQADNRLMRHESASFLETMAKICELLGLDLESAKHAEGNPSDVLFDHAKALQSELTKLADDYCKRTDELTKARELLVEGQYFGPFHWQKRIQTFLAHQSAPAAKLCAECGQPYCHGVCVERGDEDEDYLKRVYRDGDRP